MTPPRAVADEQTRENFWRVVSMRDEFDGALDKERFPKLIAPICCHVYRRFTVVGGAETRG